MPEVIRLLDGCSESLRSYDVTVKCERFFFSKTSSDKSGRARTEPKIEFQSRPPGEPVETSVSWSRQVRSREGKQRFEYLDGNRASWLDARVFDGGVVRTLDKHRASGTIRPDRPDKSPFGLPGERYANLYRELFLGGELASLFKQRSNGTVKQGQHEGKATWVIESGLQEVNMYPSFGWRIALAPNYGMMPVDIQVYEGSMNKFATTQPSME